MKLQQLRYLVGVVDNGLNITAAAQALYTSQPGVSKQLKMLEDELSVQLFRRKGKSLAGLTEAGEEIVERARRILSETENIKSLSRELSGKETGELAIATTHTQARYVLPDLLNGFHERYPGISVRLHQGTSDQIANQVQDHEADFAIASGRSDLFQDLVAFPIYHWERIVIAQSGHPLAGRRKLTLEDIAPYPIISYTHSFDKGSELDLTFKEAGVKPNVVFTAEDPDVIKTYVRK
ncbi:MAG: LysR substrate-binding domain-containing protein, partial [Xanthomonadales bacterium]|nr:LysR substrate-binding domain-containing protein [Xanthomonadales bacterium]